VTTRRRRSWSWWWLLLPVGLFAVGAMVGAASTKNWAALEAVGAATAGLASALALVFVAYTLRAQHGELHAQQEELELHRRDAAEHEAGAKRAQAEQFWAWFAPRALAKRGDVIQFHNGSGLFVYEAIAILRDWRTMPSVSYPTPPVEPPPLGYQSIAIALVVPPGDTFHIMVGKDSPGMGFRDGIEVSFTDAAGRHWRRPIGGPLQELNEGAVFTYGFDYPISSSPAFVPGTQSDGS
jgi:hypothetical protein